MLAPSALVSGCGGDKFEGKWIGYYDDGHGLVTAELTEYEIKKNGNSYLVSSRRMEIDAEKETWEESLNGTKYVHLYWRSSKDFDNQPATAKDNILTISDFGGHTITYNEADKTIIPPKTPLQSKSINLHKEADGDLEKLKDEMLAAAKEHYENQFPGVPVSLVEHPHGHNIVFPSFK